MPIKYVIFFIGAIVSLFAHNAHAVCLDWENTAVQESTPTEDFSILDDGTLIALTTNLMWKRCAEGQTLIDGICDGTPARYDWAAALVAANEAAFAGHNDWRLPNPKELLSIFEDRCIGPAFNFDVFPIYDPFGAWTATPAALLRLDLYDEVWAMDYNGRMSRHSKYSSIGVLLVRDLP